MCLLRCLEVEVLSFMCMDQVLVWMFHVSPRMRAIGPSRASESQQIGFQWVVIYESSKSSPPFPRRLQIGLGLSPRNARRR